MKAAVLHAVNTITVDELPKPTLEAGEVLIEVKYSGICGSEIARVQGAAKFFPMLQGHEFSGIVCETADDVTDVAVGEAVTVAPLVVCGVCEMCQRGYPGQCKNNSFIGTRLPGAWANYVKVPARNVVKLPIGTDVRDGAFIEPTTVAIHGLDVMKIKGGHDLVIVGMGTIGLLTLQAAKIMGAGTTYVFDIDQKKLDLALKLGADYAFNTGDSDCVEQFHKVAGTLGCDQVVETAGVAATEILVLELAAPQGTVMYIGTPNRDVTFTRDQFETINRKELKVLGSWMSYSAPFPGWEWKTAADWFSKKLIQLDPLIDRIIPLEELSNTFQDINDRKVNGKVLLEVK